MQAVIEMTAD